jgi:hypothetical protein
VIVAGSLLSMFDNFVEVTLEDNIPQVRTDCVSNFYTFLSSSKLARINVCRAIVITTLSDFEPRGERVLIFKNRCFISLVDFYKTQQIRHKIYIKVIRGKGYVASFCFIVH